MKITLATPVSPCHKQCKETGTAPRLGDREMTYEQFKVEVDHAVAAVMAAQSGLLTDMPNVDYSLTACEAASVITSIRSSASMHLILQLIAHWRWSSE